MQATSVFLSTFLLNVTSEELSVNNVMDEQEATSSTDIGYVAIADWTNEYVYRWLVRENFTKYATMIAYDHEVDGYALLHMTENDLRAPPLSIPALGDVKKLWMAIENLRKINTIEHHTALHRNQICRNNCSQCGLSDSIPTLKSSIPEIQTELHNDNVSNLQRSHSVTPDTKPKEVFKMCVAAAYCSLALLVTSFTMVIVHDRVPDMKTYPPLPDIFLDNVPLIPWAFKVCELIACLMSTILAFILFFHKSRLIIMRRMFALTGTVFLLRCVTMLITSLSVPGIHLECKARSYGDIWHQLKQAFHIWSGMGLSVAGVRTCGDYMFSGHTTAVTLLNHFITEYTPDDWRQLHTATWVGNMFAIFFILAAHEHYSIDVFIAFYISSRLFLSYHAMAQQCHFNTDRRVRTWFPFLWFFESGCSGRVPNTFEWPLPSVDSLKQIWYNGAKLLRTGNRERKPTANGNLPNGMHKSSNNQSQCSRSITLITNASQKQSLLSNDIKKKQKNKAKTH